MKEARFLAPQKETTAVCSLHLHLAVSLRPKPLSYDTHRQTQSHSDVEFRRNPAAV